jgi:uncharacterized protein RhaS with RHS repeats
MSRNWFRYYASELGRYIQSDPIGLHSGLKTYSYVASDPNDQGKMMTRPVLPRVWHFAFLMAFAVLQVGALKEASAQVSLPGSDTRRLGSVTPSLAERGVIGSEPGAVTPGSATLGSGSRIGPSASSGSSFGATGGSIRSGSTTKRSGSTVIERGPAPTGPGPGLSR